MGIFFKTPKHRVFEYKPLYYDPRKEALDEKVENARKREAGEYIPGEHIRKGFSRMKFDSKRSAGTTPMVRFFTIVSLAALIAALLYFTDAIKFLLEL